MPSCGQEDGESIPVPREPRGQGRTPVTTQLLARGAEHDKDVSHPLNLITRLLNNRVA